MSDSDSSSRSAASVVRWLAVGIALATLLVGLLLPGGAPSIGSATVSLPFGIVVFPGTISPPEKHMLGFGVVSFLLVLALRADLRRAVQVVLGLACLGLLVELIQIPIPVRSFMWIDAGAGAAGALTGALGGWFVRWVVR